MSICLNNRDKNRWWKVYISCAFNLTYKYNFYGTQLDLFTLIGVIHSTWFVVIERIDYVQAECCDKEMKCIRVYPFKKSYRTIEME